MLSVEHQLKEYRKDFAFHVDYQSTITYRFGNLLPGISIASL